MIFQVFLLYVFLLNLFIYVLDYCILYIQTMSLAWSCKNVTGLYFDGFCYYVMYNIHNLHTIFF